MTESYKLCNVNCSDYTFIFLIPSSDKIGVRNWALIYIRIYIYAYHFTCGGFSKWTYIYIIDIWGKNYYHSAI